MRTLALALMCLALGAALAGAANNIAITQPNGTVAILATVESGGVHTLTIKCQ